MSKAPAVLLLSLALSGCVTSPQARLDSDQTFRPPRYAWDGTGEDPNLPRRAARLSTTPVARAEHASAVSAEPYTQEWWAVQDGIESDREAKMKRSLVICKGCLRPQPSDDARLAKAAD
jgi:hypothetical protein